MDPIIIYTDDGSDERNARPMVVNHGRPGPTHWLGNRPGIPPVVRPPVVIYPSAPAPQVVQPAPAAVPMAPAAGPVWVPGQGWMQPAGQVPPGQMLPMPGQVPGQVPSPLGSKLGQLATPALVQAAAMLLASFLPVPPAPIATGHVEDDVANGITYTAALAAHAKTDEKIRAAGFALAQLL
jgi:hypothetical protein